jgi:predicted esterase
MSASNLSPNLPAFGASSFNVISAGHSSGAETSAHLLIAFPEIFDCVGVLNGAEPLTLQWTQDENGEDYLSYDSEEDDYEYLKGQISEMEGEGQLGDQSLLGSETRAAYVFVGEQDDVVPPWAS